MTFALVALAVTLIVVAALLGVATRSLICQLRADAAQARADAIGKDILITQRDTRIANLERQIQVMHSKGITTEAPAAESAPPPSPLPPDIQDFLDGVEDPDAREEFEAVARHSISTGTHPDAVLAEFTS